VQNRHDCSSLRHVTILPPRKQARFASTHDMFFSSTNVKSQTVQMLLDTQHVDYVTQSVSKHTFIEVNIYTCTTTIIRSLMSQTAHTIVLLPKCQQKCYMQCHIQLYWC